MNRKLILKSPRFVPFDANLAQLEAKSNILNINANNCCVLCSVVLLAEDSMIQDKMALHGVELQTVAEVSPIQIHPARVLSKIYSLLGMCWCV